MPALSAAAVETMDQLSWLDSSQRELLDPWRYQTLLNARGKQVGEVRTCFQLTVAGGIQAAFTAQLACGHAASLI